MFHGGGLMDQSKDSLVAWVHLTDFQDSNPLLLNGGVRKSQGNRRTNRGQEAFIPFIPDDLKDFSGRKKGFSRKNSKRIHVDLEGFPMEQHQFV